jgi:hypothetical protein
MSNERFKSDLRDLCKEYGITNLVALFETNVNSKRQTGLVQIALPADNINPYYTDLKEQLHKQLKHFDQQTNN